MRRLLACDPLLPCPEGVKALEVGGELAKRFSPLADGRVALAGVPDYSPASVPDRSWNRRLQTFWLPAWPQEGWAQFNGDGSARLISHGPRQRTVRVEANGMGSLRLMQWAHPSWRVQLRPAHSLAAAWSPPLPKGARDADGWISVSLPQGQWEVALSYGFSRLNE
jgi:hypothetical protein